MISLHFMYCIVHELLVVFIYCIICCTVNDKTICFSCKLFIVDLFVCLIVFLLFVELYMCFARAAFLRTAGAARARCIIALRGAEKQPKRARYMVFLGAARRAAVGDALIREH